MSFSFKRGATLNNGATIMDYRPNVTRTEAIVLCKWDHKNEYVSWRVDAEGNAEHGRYFDGNKLTDALKDFSNRHI